MEDRKAGFIRQAARQSCKNWQGWVGQAQEIQDTRGDGKKISGFRPGQTKMTGKVRKPGAGPSPIHARSFCVPFGNSHYK